MRRHTSYKDFRKQDILEIAIQEEKKANRAVYQAEQAVQDCETRLLKARQAVREAKQVAEESKKRIISLFKETGRTLIIVDRVKYYIQDDKLVKELILD